MIQTSNLHKTWTQSKFSLLLLLLLLLLVAVVEDSSCSTQDQKLHLCTWSSVSLQECHRSYMYIPWSFHGLQVCSRSLMHACNNNNYNYNNNNNNHHQGAWKKLSHSKGSFGLGLGSKKTKLRVMKKELWMKWVNEMKWNEVNEWCIGSGVPILHILLWMREKGEVFGDLGRGWRWGRPWGLDFLGFVNPTSMPNWVSRVHPRDLWFLFLFF